MESLSWKREDGNTMDKADLFKAMRAKVEAMWQIATNDACGRRLREVAQLHLEISKIGLSLESNYPEVN